MKHSANIGTKLKQLRKTKGLTQAKLAELSGLHEKHISKLELGIYTPSLDTLNKIIKVLDVTIEDIGLSFEKVSVNDNPFYIKSLQILNNSTDEELEILYKILKCGQEGIAIYKKK